MTHTDNIRAYVASILSECDAIDGVTPPANWWMTLNSNAPYYEADFVNGQYYAAGADQGALAAFKTATGYAGTTSLGSIGLQMGSQNKIWPSNDFTNANWTKGLATITANSVMASDGTMTASTLTENTTSGFHECEITATVVASTINCMSIEVKAGTRTKGRIWYINSATGYYADFDLTAGTIGSATNFGGTTPASSSITSLSNGWYRVSVSGNAGTLTNGRLDISLRDASGNASYAGTGGTMYIARAQAESGSSFTSYYPTTVAPVISQLTANVTAPTTITRVIHARTGPLPTDSYATVHHLDNNTNTTNGYSDLELYRYSDGHLYVECKYLSTTTISGKIDLGAIADNTDFKLAYTASAAGIIASLNGGTALTSTVVTFPPDFTYNRLNGNMTDIRQWGGSVALDAVWFDTATGIQLQTLST